MDHAATEPGPSWAERAEIALADAGYRRGGARAAVIELLAGQRCALSAIEIEDQLRFHERSVARASIYRILEELDALGLVTRVEVGHGLTRFEASQHGHHHHHMVCERCGRVLPFADEALEDAIRDLAGQVEFVVSGHDVVLHGRCADCGEVRPL